MSGNTKHLSWGTAREKQAVGGGGLCGVSRHFLLRHFRVGVLRKGPGPEGRDMLGPGACVQGQREPLKDLNREVPRLGAEVWVRMKP